MWPCTHGCADACTHNPVNGKVYLVCVCTYVCVCVCLHVWFVLLVAVLW